MSNVTKSADITKKKIAAPKALMLISAVIALILDVLVMVILFFNTTDFKFILCPAILLAIDITYIIKVVFSNYRFSYAVKDVIIHVIAVALVSIFAFISTGLLETRIIFETFALYAMPAAHIIQAIAALVTALGAAKVKSLSQKIITAAISAVFVLTAVIYGNFLLSEGFFGQTSSHKDRTVVYSLDESGSSYIVEDVLSGYGNTVTIPEQFNGKPVSGINCGIFANKELAYVVFDCSADIEFLNVASLNLVNENITLETSKSKLDTLRGVLYSAALSNSQMLHLANHIVPSDLESGEVYLTFRYSKDVLAIVKDDILPTWFGRAGQSFDIYDHASSVLYVEHSGLDNVSDLYWCEQNQNGLIFSKAVNESSENVSRATVNESLSAEIVFEQIYQVKIGEDNDEKYSLDKVYTSIEVLGEEKDYKLAVADRIMSLLESVPSRDGFDLHWYVGQNELIDLDTELAKLSQSGMTRLDVSPVWDLQAPTIDSILADGVYENHSKVYGSNVQLTSSAKPPHSSISVKYEWTKGAFTSDKQNPVIENIHPEDAGEYTLSVTAWAPTTSLTKTVSKTINVGFEKKSLGFSWILPEDMVYSATVKTVNAIYSAADVINGDTIDFELSAVTVKDAKDYTISATLFGDAATKYKIPTSESAITFTIFPYTVSAKWGDTTSFVYNATNQKPTASAEGLLSDVIEVEVKGAARNVGEYKATASSKNKNYVISTDTAEKPFTITPKAITYIYWDNSSFTYNAKEQSAKASSLTGVIDSESKTVISSLIYEGASVNVGSYTVNVRLPENANYYFSCTTSTGYTISKKDLTVRIKDVQTIYNGLPYTSFSYSATGLAGQDLASEVFSLNYKGAATTAINASYTPYEISADILPSTKYNNYNISLETGALTINRRSLNVTISNVSKTYDGKIADSSTFDYTYAGLCDTDTISEVVTLSYYGDATEQVNAGTWYIRANAVYGAKYDNYNVYIESGTLTINKAPLTVTAVGGSKIYDGAIFSDYSFKADGLVGGDQKSDLGTASYGGAALSTKTVGIHVLTVTLLSNLKNSNYEITYQPGSVEITKKNATVTVTDGSKVYNGVAGGSFDFTIQGLASGDYKSSFVAKYSGSATENKDVGTYEVTLEFNENSVTKNYNFNVIPGTYKITKKDVTVSAASISKTYDGKAGADFTFTVNGLCASDTIASFGKATYSGAATTAKDAGSYSLSVRVEGNSNYNITKYYDGTLTVTKKTVYVTPTAETKVYDGKAGSSFSIEVDGLCEGDSVSALGTPRFGGAATTLSTAGTHLLTVTLDNNTLTKNYSFVISTGTLVIEKKELTVYAVAKDRKQDGRVGGDFSFKVEGLCSSDTASILGTPIYGGSATNASAPGSYVLTVTFEKAASLENYFVTYVSDDFEIYAN